jgi:hypothetical protein
MRAGSNPRPHAATARFGVQEIVATFLASGGTSFLLPEPSRYFEFLTDPASLEDLNYIP